jgi:hypothetical protein
VLCSLLLSKADLAKAAKIRTMDAIERAPPVPSPGGNVPAAALGWNWKSEQVP